MTTRVEITGPIVNGRGGPIVKKHMSNATRELMQLGEQRLDKLLRPRPAGVFLSASQAGPGKASTGNYRRHVHGVQKETTARIDDGGVIYGPWLEGVSSRNATTRFKGYSSFRRTAQWLRGQVNRVAQAHVKRAVQELSGRGI